jgi:hypothetical protein
VQNTSYLTPEALSTFIRAALAEDVGDGDHSSLASVPADAQNRAQLLVKDEGVLAGVELAHLIFREVDPSLQVGELLADGARVKHGDVVLTVAGRAQSILYSEMKRILSQALVFGWLILSSGAAQAQGDAFGSVSIALRNASSRELSQYFGATVEISIDGDRQSYSATQAEFVMKDFFSKTSPANFEIVHQGASPGGIPYAVGKYKGKGGSYRVFVKMKSANGTLRIDNMEFTKE